MTAFSDLGLNPAILQSLETEGYTTPTPIQAQAIPSILEGRDVLGIAQTGTGKTAAFALPILHRLAAERRPAPRRGARALILSPTRELAAQIAESFRTYGRNLGLSIGVIFGGVAHRPQAQMMARGLDVLVATPGRLIDHMTEGNINLSTTEILVLDEADQMLDLGFIRPLRQIIAKLPSRRQGLFFSATMPHEIGALAAELLREPVQVTVTPVAKTADRVAQRVIFVETQRKRALLVELLADPAMSRTLIFTRTKRGADRVALHLEAAGVAAAAIHGNKSQVQRERALEAFKGTRIRALVATDIAARGIDVDEVSHVVNYELPNIPESYVHRIGRTARAGAEGIAISLCDNEERAYLKDIERLTRQTIPAEDRRGDAGLGEAAAASGEGRRPERGDANRNNRDGQRPRANSGHRGSHAERRQTLADTAGDPRRERSRHPHGDRAQENRRHEQPAARAHEPAARRHSHTDAAEGPRHDRPRHPHGDRVQENRRHEHPAAHAHEPAARRQEHADRPRGEQRKEGRAHELSNVRFLSNHRDRRDGQRQAAGGNRHPGPRLGAKAGARRPRTH